MAAEVQFFGLHVPGSGDWAVYARISNPELFTPQGGVTQTAGLASVTINVLNNSSGSLTSVISSNSVRTMLPGGMTNTTDPEPGPGNLGTLGYGFWAARSVGGDVIYFNTGDPATGGVTVGDSQFTSYSSNAATYEPLVLTGVGLSSGSKPLGENRVSDFQADPTGTYWANPVLVAKGKYTPPATSGPNSTLGLKLTAPGVNVIQNIAISPRVEAATTKIVDPRTLANPTPTNATTTFKAGVGDANLDGQANFADLVLVAQNYGTQGSWFEGDFNFDGWVNFADLVTLAQVYGSAVPGSVPDFGSDVGLAFATVPEPGTAVSLIVLSSLLTFRRRRRMM